MTWNEDNNNAILVFNGDTFKGLNAKSFSKEEIFIMPANILY